MQSKFFSKPLFWILATLTSLGMGYAAYRVFPIAFPIVSVDLTMDRSGALSQASTLAEQHSIGPKTFSQATTFGSDNKAKIFIQLEGGGVQKFQDVIKEEYFAPYYWQVRHFNPCQKHESTFYFMPDGRPYGFKELIPDDELLPTLDKAQAQELAQKEAAKIWFIDFSKHTLVEHSTEEKPNGRVDHTLVYERTDATAGQAPYRVTIKVTGNKVTKTQISLKIPEAFERRYAHMRSANSMIANWASTAMFLLYLLLGCLLGLILLVRRDRDWLLLRSPLFWASFISLGMLLDNLNSSSMWWIYYPTTDSTFSFLASIIQSMLMGAGLNFVLLYVSFLAAESLTRKAFPNQIQLWSSADTDVASSWQMLGRTVGGYLIISFDFIFVTLFYLFSIKYLGWWSPADTLVDPNVLANYVPWFSPFINALRAGFWEECLFRAVPLACAMLLAKRYGKKYWWMGSAMILQAVIFAAAHASYPAQPSYARLVELIIPSFVFGGLYLAFGLIPAIISHVLFDLILMALPILVSDAPGSFWNKGMVAFCGLIPLLVILRARALKGRWHTLSERWYNGNWQAPFIQRTAHTEEIHEEPVQPTHYRTAVLIAGLIGLGGWAVLRHKAQDVQPLAINREQAIAQAQEAQNYFNLTIPSSMSMLSDAKGKMNKKNIFVWRTGGKEVYQQLDGTFITSPHWKVRYAQFDGDIAQSAEEYDIYIDPNGKPMEYQHTLPKEQEGASLTQDEARKLALDVLQSYYQLQPDDIVEVSAQEEKQPNRRDWQLVYRLKKGPDLDEGHLRIRIDIGGNQVIGHDRLVYVPEKWEREYEYESKIEKLIKSSSLILLLALILLLGTIIIRRRPIHPFALRTALVVLGLMVTKTIIQTFNLWPTMVIGFETSAPYGRQIGMLITSLLLTTIVISLFFAWLSGYVIGLLHGRCTKSRVETMLQGICIGLVSVGLTALGSWIVPPTKPLWLDISNAGAYLPWLSMGLKGLTAMLSGSLIGLLMLHGVNMLSDYGRKKHFLLASIFILLGIAASGFDPATSLHIWLATGIAIGLLMLALYYTVLRFNYCVMIVFVATITSIEAIQDALLQAFPSVWLGALLTIVISWLTALWLMNQLRTQTNENTKG